MIVMEMAYVTFVEGLCQINSKNEKIQTEVSGFFVFKEVT